MTGVARLLLFAALGLGAYNCQNIGHEPMALSTNAEGLRKEKGLLLYSGIPFTGVLRDSSKGQKTLEVFFEDGVKEGLSRKWYSNGQLAERRLFENGLKVGLHQGWWYDGGLRFRYQFKDGKHDGKAEEWMESGQQYRAFHYEEGREAGPQKMWWPSGKLRANYVVKNGKRYGMIGYKLCKSSLDSLAQ